MVKNIRSYYGYAVDMVIYGYTINYRSIWLYYNSYTMDIWSMFNGGSSGSDSPEVRSYHMYGHILWGVSPKT